MAGTIVWTVPRVEVPTKRGLVVIALRRGRAEVISGEARLTPIDVPAFECSHIEPAHGARRLTPADGHEYLVALADANRAKRGARYVYSASEILEWRLYFRRRGRLSATVTAHGEITVHGETSDAGRRWLSRYAVPSPPALASVQCVACNRRCRHFALPLAAVPHRCEPVRPRTVIHRDRDQLARTSGPEDRVAEHRMQRLAGQLEATTTRHVLGHDPPRSRGSRRS